MAAPSPVREPRRPRRRGGRLLAVAVLGVLAILIGRGLGLVGRDESDDVAPEPEGSASMHARGAGGGEQRAGDGAAPAAPLGEARAAAAPAESRPAEPPQPGIDADRFASLLSVADTWSERGDVGSAMSALSQLRQMPLNEPQRLALAVSARDVETGLAAACTDVVKLLCDGRALDAHAAIVRLLGGDDHAAQPWLQSALQLAGLADVSLHGTAPVHEAIPQAQPMPRGRAVRSRIGNAIIAGVVADSRSDQVTVRLQQTNGTSFPTI